MVSLDRTAGVPMRCWWRGAVPGHCRARVGLLARLLPLLAALAASDRWHFQGRQKGGDKPGRLVGNKVKSACPRVFLACQGPKIAPVCRSGALTLFLCPPETSFAVVLWLA